MSDLAFELRVASSGNVASCFYAEVRRASTDAIIVTKGSATTPIGCVSTATQTSFTVAVPEVVSSTVANDLRIRVFGRNASGQATPIDMVRATGSTPSGAFTLLPASVNDAAAGTAPGTFPWSLERADTAFFTPASQWATSFATTRYLAIKLPAYTPGAATGVSMQLTHAYRSATAGAETCVYIEAYAGATLLATKGSAAAPLSCTTSATTYQTDTIPLPEVDTPAKANDLTVRIYVRSNGKNNQRSTQHDVFRAATTFVG